MRKAWTQHGQQTGLGSYIIPGNLIPTYKSALWWIVTEIEQRDSERPLAS